jgi:hypothetical protein
MGLLFLANFFLITQIEPELMPAQLKWERFGLLVLAGTGTGSGTFTSLATRKKSSKL